MESDLECAGNSNAPPVSSDQSIRDAAFAPSTVKSSRGADGEPGLISSVNAGGEDRPKLEPVPTCVNTMCDSGFSSPQNESALCEGHYQLIAAKDDPVLVETEEIKASSPSDQTPTVTDTLLTPHPSLPEPGTDNISATNCQDQDGQQIPLQEATAEPKKEREDGELTTTEDEEDVPCVNQAIVVEPSLTLNDSLQDLAHTFTTENSETLSLRTPTKSTESTPVVPKRSSLKRRRSSDQDGNTPKRKKISFAAVTAYYFPRSQGFTCIPSQGGSTLGMSLSHSHMEKYSLVEHAAEQRRIHREFLRQLKQRQSGSSSSATTNSSGDDSESGAEGQSSDLSDSELDADNYYFLQPLPTRQRRALLKASGVSKIEPLEKEECRDIRSSRESCGCSCKVYCDPDVCSCAQAGIKCQVDRLNFPCGCSRDACANPSGRIEFNPVRVRTHFIHTLMRIELEANQSQHPNPDAKTEPPTTSTSLACMEMEHNSHVSGLEATNFGSYNSAWNNANLSHDTYVYSATTNTNNPCSFTNVATSPGKVSGSADSLPRPHFVNFHTPSTVTNEYHPNPTDVINESSSHYANLHLLSYDCQLPVPATESAPLYHPPRHPNPMDLYAFTANETYQNTELAPVGQVTYAKEVTGTAALQQQPSNYVPFYDYNPSPANCNAFSTTYEYYDNPTYEALPKPYNALENVPSSAAYCNYSSARSVAFEQATSTSTYGEAACYSSQYSPNGCSINNFVASAADMQTAELKPVEQVLTQDSSSKMSHEDIKDVLVCPFLEREQAKGDSVQVQSDAGESSKSDSTSSSDEDGLAATENNLGTIMKETMVVSV